MATVRVLSAFPLYVGRGMSLIDEVAADAAALVDTARRLQSTSMLVHDLIEHARRELDQLPYEGPGANADRSELNSVAAAAHGLGNALDAMSSALFRAAANLPVP
jgi:hypothetical protein